MHARHLTALTIALALGASMTADGASFGERDATWTNGDIRLAGTLLTPNGDGPFPAAVLIQGSGKSDRTNAWSRAWAEALATHGIAALLTDKRGCGESEGDWTTAGFAELTEDIVAGVAWLRAQEEIRDSSIGIIGLSQGGFYAPAVAVADPRVAFIVSVSGAAVTPVEQVNHEMRNTFRQAGLDEAGVAAGMQIQKLAENYVRTGDWASYRAGLDAAMASPLKPIAEGFPQTEESPVWTFWRKIADFDPIRDWAAAKQPGLVLYGEDDEHDNVPVAESVTRLRRLAEESHREVTAHVFPGRGHGIFEPDTTPRRLDDDAVELLVRWIQEKTRSRPDRTSP